MFVKKGKNIGTTFVPIVVISTSDCLIEVVNKDLEFISLYSSLMRVSENTYQYWLSIISNFFFIHIS